MNQITSQICNLFSLHIYLRDHVNLRYGRDPRSPRQKGCSETKWEVVTATRGEERGTKCFPKAIPSNCEISDCAARFMLARPQRMILAATSSDPQDLLDLNAKKWHAHVYAVRIETNIYLLWNNRFIKVGGKLLYFRSRHKKQSVKLLIY